MSSSLGGSSRQDGSSRLGGSSRRRNNKASRASKLFFKYDANINKSLEREEMETYIESQDQLWEKLSSRLKQPKEMAIQCATLVAMELATGLQGEIALNFALTKEQFKEFHRQYVKDPDGSEEFFQRTVFAFFDEDNSGELDLTELDTFLDAIYETRQVRKGKVMLHTKDHMKALILETHDKDGGGTLDFNEIRKIMSGGAKALQEVMDESAKDGIDVSHRIDEVREETIKLQEQKEKEAASGGKKKSFNFFTWIVDLVTPPNNKRKQQQYDGDGQLVSKNGFCIIL